MNYTDVENLIKDFYKYTGKDLTTDPGTDEKHYSIEYVQWLENKLVGVVCSDCCGFGWNYDDVSGLKIACDCIVLS